LKAKDKISEDYRKQVDELIDNQSDLDLFNPLNQEELDEIWEEISTEMDIGEVWNDISSDLDIVMPVDSGSGKIIKSIAAILIILIGMIPVKKAILDSLNDQTDKFTEIKQYDQSAELIIKNKSVNINIGEKVKRDISPVLMKSLNKDGAGNKSNLLENNRTGSTHEKTITGSNKVVFQYLSAHISGDSNLALSTDHIPFEQSIILPAVVPEDNLNRISVSLKTDISKPVIDNNYSVTGSSIPLAGSRKISIGFMTLLKNTWLLNNETFDGLKYGSLSTSEIVFFPDVGLSLNYSITKSWLLQADGFLYSNTGQEYLEYINGHYSRKKITLKYSTIALSIKHKFIGSSHLIPRSSINVLAGGYLSVLHYANQEINYANLKINTDLENIGSQYEKFDFGVRLGGEFEFQIFDQLSLAPGLFLSIGIPNIYRGNGDIPPYLIRTHNGSAEFHLTFYYHFD
jgi:hypothetical protein